VDTKAAKLDGEGKGYDDIETLLRKLHISPAVEPAKLGNLAASSTPGWAWG
jgi:hypothetical protein